MRVGIGYDSHRFQDGRPLLLGGVQIPDSPGLSGHSDGDAVAHAVIDALLGAAAAGDVGKYFPPDDQRWKDADSMVLLERVVAILRQRDLAPRNVDVTVICERPKISPRARAMRQRLSSVLSIPLDCVSVKGKTNEGMGWIGAGEGIAVLAVATVASGASSDGGYHGATPGIPI